jgi:hypothetical protein
MAVLELSKEQIFDLVRQMSAADKQEMLQLLARNTPADRARRQQPAEDKLRALCATRGLNWDAMRSEQRETFIDDLVHEDRPWNQRPGSERSCTPRITTSGRSS